MRLTVLTLMSLPLAAAAFAAGQPTGGHADMRVTIDHRMTATLAPDVGRSAHRIVIEVDAYQPSRDGPVMAVVSVDCGGNVHEIGRFGVFPDMPFAVSDSVAPQRFGFELPSKDGCGIATGVVVRLEPVRGDGREASMSISAIWIE